MHWLTRFSLRNRSLVALAVIAVLVFGGIAVTSLSQELMPSIEYPALTVFAAEPGASPTDVEQGVTIPLEAGLKGLPGLNELDSYSNENMAIMVAMFEYGTNMDEAQTAAQQAVDRAAPNLPSGVEPQVKAINFGDFPVMQLAVSSPLPPEELSTKLRDRVVPQLRQITGVGDVSLSGVQTRQLMIRLDAGAMAQAGVSPQAIPAALRSADLSMPIGTVTDNGTTIPVRVISETASLEELKQLPLQSVKVDTGGAAVSGGGPQTVTLGEIADLSIEKEPASTITRTDGKPSIGIAINKTADGNVVNISEKVNSLLSGMEEELGEGSTITVVVDQAPYINESISSMWEEGILGAIFAVLVILLFLRSWRSTIVAGISIPLSVIIALIVLWTRADTLNMLTLAGLTIAIGRVIDDSIVVLENAYRHLQEGDDPMTAASTATKEVSAAITASTLTTVAVFLPLGFVQGISSEFFRPFALTVTFALLASLLVALTIVPVAVTWLLSKGYAGHRDKNEITGLQRAYLPVLRMAIAHKPATVIIAFLVFAGSVALTPLLNTNLLDHSEETTLTITQQLAPGTSTEKTSEKAAQMEDLLATTESVDTYQVTIGSTGGLFGPGGGANASSARAQFTVNLTGGRSKTAVVEELRSQVKSMEDVGEVSITSGDPMGGESSSINVVVYAEDPATLKQANSKVLAKLQDVGGLANLSSNLSESRPQIAVHVNRAKAAAAGLDPAQVGQFLSLILSGMPAGEVPTEEGPLPAKITLPLLTDGAATSEQLSGLTLMGGAGPVPLSSVATVEEAAGPAQITHIDGERTVTISAAAVSNNVGQTSTDVETALADLELPDGARWEMAGASEQMNDMFRSLGLAMLVAILVVYLIMVGTFRSLLNPLILLVSIPFAAVGAVLLLLLTGTSLGMPSLIGLLMLIGIVVTNAIVLLDLVEQYRDQGMDAQSAIMEGGRRRLRPILMTAVATILALTPMALGLSEGSFLSRPLALVVIGGLFTSTILTLIIVPVVYLTFDRFRKRDNLPV